MLKRILNKVKVKTIAAKAKLKPKLRLKRAKRRVSMDTGVLLAKDIKNLAGTYCELLVVEPNLQRFGSYPNEMDGHKFPNEILLKQITPYGTMMHIVYYNGKRDNGAYVPNDFKFKSLEPGPLTLAYEKYLIDSLYCQLGHSLVLGSDPEMFVEDESGKVIPAFNFLGSKEKPNKTFISDDVRHGGTKMYWDGFQAEFETMAMNCLGWHTDSVFCGIKGLYDAAKAHNPKAKLSLKTTMDIDYELLQSSAEEHVQFGCMPSYNAYNMKGLDLNGRDVPFRSAGGHIHFGIGKTTHEQALPIVKALDAILGVACVSLFAKFDDPRRRRMYGLAGEYRLPPHGIEYRVLSNAWMAHPAIMNLVFDVSRKVLVLGQKGLLKYWKHDEAETIEIINTCDAKRAREVLERNKDLFIQIISAAYGLGSTKTKEAYKAFLAGMENVIQDPTDIEKNWLVGPKDKWINHANSTGKNWNSAAEILANGKKVG